MASSLIRINEATADELCQLPWVDADLAARIVSYRNGGNLIKTPADLARAADIDPAEAIQMASAIDWEVARKSSLPFILAIVVCAGLLVFSISTSGLETTRPATMLFNTSVILILLGCLFAIARVIVGYASSIGAAITLASVSTWVSGMALLLALMVVMAATNSSDAFAEHVLGSGKFVAFIGVVVSLLYGPDLVVARTRSPYRWAALFDLGQLLLAPLAAFTLKFNQAFNPLDALFSLWIAVMLGHNGFTMYQGRSSFADALSNPARRNAFDVQDTYYPVSNKQLRRTGVATMIMAGTLMAFVFVRFLESQFP
ncbi:MAG: helix-hairpin-helix domain-containing protein [Pseudomonadales bacterium]